MMFATRGTDNRYNAADLSTFFGTEGIPRNDREERMTTDRRTTTTAMLTDNPECGYPDRDPLSTIHRVVHKYK